MSFELSDVQKRIVNHKKGHLRIVACPGSGKTETVSHRIAQMIADGEEPSQIVAFTFTRKAAENLRHRIRRHPGTNLTCSHVEAVRIFLKRDQQ
jgi:DNA helicase-2/ATP-dependent DNA helicase PcrA